MGHPEEEKEGAVDIAFKTSATWRQTLSAVLMLCVLVVCVSAVLSVLANLWSITWGLVGAGFGLLQ